VAQNLLLISPQITLAPRHTRVETGILVEHPNSKRRWTIVWAEYTTVCGTTALAALSTFISYYEIPFLRLALGRQVKV
jgi:hypothetical protein